MNYSIRKGFLQAIDTKNLWIFGLAGKYILIFLGVILYTLIIARASDAKAAKNTGIFYIEGTGDTAGTWLGSHSDITEYYAGLILAYKIGVAGLSSGTTLNINNLGAVTVVKNATSAISTNFAVNSVIFLVYTIDSSGTAYWKAHDYDSNTKTTTGTSNKASTKLFLTGATS